MWVIIRGVWDLGFKGASAIAQENACGIGVSIRSDDVKVAIPVHISQGYGEWPTSRAEVCFVTKGAIAIAQLPVGVASPAVH